MTRNRSLLLTAILLPFALAIAGSAFARTATTVVAPPTPIHPKVAFLD